MNFESIFDPTRKVPLLAPFGLAVSIVILDLITPTPVGVSIFFVLPVIIAGWYHGPRWALLFAVVLPLVRLFITIDVEHNMNFGFSAINTFDRIIVLSIISFIAAKLSDSMRRLGQEVKILEGLIPICANCKKIRDTNDDWQQMEVYISERSETQFTHTVCPDCMKVLYGDFLDKHKA